MVMSTLTISPQRKKPGPSPRTGPKATSTTYSVYPVDRAAIRWWAASKGAESDAAALRQMIDIAMSLTLGADWADQIEQEAA